MVRRTRYTPPASVRQRVLTEVVPAAAPRAGRLRFPEHVWLAGSDELLQAKCRVAIVGSRDAGPEALERARRVAVTVVRAGGLVVSGLAKGVDRAAHEAAIEAGGRTIAVIGTPIEKAYPAENGDLQERIYREHLLVSQFEPGKRVFPGNFPERNRLMAAIAHATVIVEASNTSGTLSQAAECQRLGHDLFIMKAIVDNPERTWPESFVRTGAIVLERPSELLSRAQAYQGD